MGGRRDEVAVHIELGCPSRRRNPRLLDVGVEVGALRLARIPLSGLLARQDSLFLRSEHRAAGRIDHMSRAGRGIVGHDLLGRRHGRLVWGRLSWRTTTRRALPSRNAACPMAAIAAKHLIWRRKLWLHPARDALHIVHGFLVRRHAAMLVHRPRTGVVSSRGEHGIASVLLPLEAGVFRRPMEVLDRIVDVLHAHVGGGAWL